jgi:hypothetical protein
MSGGFAGGISWLYRNTFRKTAKLFDEACRDHDLEYHMEGFGRRRADLRLKRRMRKAIQKVPKWFRGWSKGQAVIVYEAVEHGGEEAYEVAQQECRDNQRKHLL